MPPKLLAASMTACRCSGVLSPPSPAGAALVAYVTGAILVVDGGAWMTASSLSRYFE